jgi:hypothetical protein
MRKIILLLLCLVFISIQCANNLAGGTDETQTSIGFYGKLVLNDGSAVENAEVTVFKSSDTIPVDTTLTNDTGYYIFTDLANGTYDLEARYIKNKDTLYTKHLDIYHDSITYVGVDTLLPPGFIKGQVHFDEDDKTGVLAGISGTSYLAFTDYDGKFIISGVPPGSFYKVTYRYTGYLQATDSNITVYPRDTTHLGIKELVRDTSAPPPTPQNVSVNYDIVQGIVKIGWKPINYNYLSGYLIYRKDSSKTAVYPELISGTTLITDTFFYDTVFHHMKDSIPVVYQYHVKSQDKKNSLSEISQPAFTRVLPFLPPDNCSAMYDSIQGIVTVTWATVNRAYLAGYCIYRKDSSASTNLELLNSTYLIEDTVFYDSIYNSLEDTLIKTYQYQIVSQDVKEFRSIFSQPVYQKITPPDIPGNVSPVNGDTGVEWSTNLVWTPIKGSITDTVTYTVYFGTSYPPANTVVNDTTDTTVQIKNLMANTTYYWYVSASCKNITVYSPVWCFKTIDLGETKWEYPIFNNYTTSNYVSGLNACVGHNGLLYFSFQSTSLIDGIRYSSIRVLNRNGSEINGNNWLNSEVALLAISNNGTILLSENHSGIRGNSKLMAYSYDLSIKWEFLTLHSKLSKPALGPDGTIYISGTNNTLYSIDPNGFEKWKYFFDGSMVNAASYPVISNTGIIYIMVNNADKCALYSINTDGSTNWSRNILPRNENVTISAAIGTDGTIYAIPSGFNPIFYAFDSNGDIKWTLTLNGFCTTSPVVDSKGTIYVQCRTFLYAINPNGTVTWRNDYFEDRIIDCPAIGNDGCIYMNKVDNLLDTYLYVLNPDSTLKWKTNLFCNEFCSSPILAHEDLLYIITDKNCVAVKNTSGGLAPDGWPMIMRNLQHTGRQN